MSEQLSGVGEHFMYQSKVLGRDLGAWNLDPAVAETVRDSDS